MAYRKNSKNRTSTRSKTRTRARSQYGANSGRRRTASSKRTRKSSSQRAQTLRIVIEQPNAASGMAVAPTVKTARKAVF